MDLFFIYDKHICMQRHANSSTLISKEKSNHDSTIDKELADESYSFYLWQTHMLILLNEVFWSSKKKKNRIFRTSTHIYSELRTLFLTNSN